MCDGDARPAILWHGAALLPWIPSPTVANDEAPETAWTVLAARAEAARAEAAKSRRAPASDEHPRTTSGAGGETSSKAPASRSTADPAVDAPAGPEVQPSEGAQARDAENMDGGVVGPESAMDFVEHVFDGVAWTVWALVLATPLAAALFDWHPQSTTAGILFLAAGAVTWAVIMLDMVTYRPPLFASCAGPAELFFVSLSRMHLTLEDRVESIAISRARTFRSAKFQAESLLQEANEFFLLAEIRGRLSRRILHRLAAIVGSLALMSYGLSLLSDNGLILPAAGTARPRTPRIYQRTSSCRLVHSTDTATYSSRMACSGTYS